MDESDRDSAYTCLLVMTEKGIRRNWFRPNIARAKRAGIDLPTHIETRGIQLRKGKVFVQTTSYSASSCSASSLEEPELRVDCMERKMQHRSIRP